MNRAEPMPWRGFRAIEKLIILLLPLLAAVALLLPSIDQAFLRRLARVARARPFVAWLVNGYNAWIVAGALLLLTALFVLWLRHRLVSDQRLWYGAGCPNCMERELVRVSRRKGDRLYGLAAIPAYRYACRNCTWRGLRIARREYSPERELELEEALLRFQPDGAADLASSREGAPTGADLRPPVLAGSSGMFRDAGDVSRSDIPGALSESLNGQTDEMEAPSPPAEEDNHQLESEPLEGMEWLWRRSSDS